MLWFCRFVRPAYDVADEMKNQMCVKEETHSSPPVACLREGWNVVLVCVLKFLEERRIVFREHSEVRHLIFEVGYSLHSEAEGISAIHLAVYAAQFEHIGVHHAASENFHPSGVFAESASLSSADMAGDVHLCRRFREGEV